MVEAEKKEQHLCGSFKVGIAGKAFSGRPALGKKWRKKNVFYGLPPGADGSMIRKGTGIPSAEPIGFDGCSPLFLTVPRFCAFRFSVRRKQRYRSFQRGCARLTFANLKFIFAFLPASLVLYYIVPKRLKNYVLLVGSLLFYGLGSWWQTGLLAADVTVNYFLAGTFSGSRGHCRHRRLCFWLTVAANTALLVWFKCRSTIPIGISFYTFQMIAYQADVYRGTIPREESLLRFGTFMFFFPKLQEGPITRYDELSMGLRRPVCRAENLEEGFRLFVMGLAYKALLADKLGGLWKQLSIIGYDSVSTPMAWLGMGAYTLQLYFDFHGYSLMAVGVGKMFGFSLPLNFLFPYSSTSVSDFYRRWHATLGRWFRDYVYIPMGGSREGMARTIGNLLFVWLLTGLWHGIHWNFVLWGLSLFVLIALEKLFLRKWLEKNPFLGHLYVLLFIPLTWMLFANTNFSDLAVYFARLFPFGGSGISVYAGDWLEYGRNYAPYLLAGCVFLIPQSERFLLDNGKHRVVTTVILAAFFWMSVYSIHSSANNPFMYLQF
jgi:alginate O-acetyltransferase complex protein AlgI